MKAEWQNNYLFNTCFYPQVFQAEECTQIIELQGKTKKSGLCGKAEPLDSIRNSISTYLPIDETTQWIYNRLYPLVQYLNDNFYHFKIEGLASGQVIEYGQGGHYDWHVDMGLGESSARKLSIVVFLSDRSSYQGGTLKLITGLRMEEDVPQEQGTVIFFPSYMLHRVEPVTQGVRHTLVIWAYGPCFS
ncbi:hypothetical protein COW36_01310 [bacterium (Candidatus Blackallbacteria) CG17_big_fil_post_rev_8_21_14_2_50_48_46]|uniref:Fe2OG dioxygenase domain-containing protein n=1 Tax=bacterium (Candidatus Blackallbacteria) CG17_big_fil_post_rev_8_21_14_2_50_48_46 TaxID=2014261 RepID=A0A2M7GBE2_9BACT|nr:MAG: hypothetical protein COW64_09865 [bacterium (Candidatus Blackallbacteria) CG18_big_fil_WC_8_21_14_2_50_49_26]PIW19505.1 MAG: hypothetical protein COW36_01310 [bacterium (Candidatus Blackallbacteria) CG17_big_fil_post_rev_8_21_14_2_50_48_46]PIW48891.1 MAG: hypothetical protein COW20_07145 [bacterium (Candidatus Blackallbacteria) CG13_big_fil_rev_8_21_14_2_50_49_14]